MYLLVESDFFYDARNQGMIACLQVSSLILLSPDVLGLPRKRLSS